MKWFRGLEGARAWLAWVVVLSHVVKLCAVPRHVPFTQGVVAAGDTAVNVFIVISGFVITNLILEKPEPYPAYILRRFMRIYPLYLVCLAAGVVATFAFVHVASVQPWGANVPFTGRMIREAQSIQGVGLPQQLLTHLTLLHGAVSSNVLFESEYAFLSPAWSLSLEWQFYLIAPLVVLAARRQTTAIIATLLAVAAYAAYRKGLLGTFILPSFLPGAIFQFSIGILTRFAIPKVREPGTYPLAPLILAAAGVHFLAPDQMHYVIWFALVAYMISGISSDRVSIWATRALNVALDSRAANWLGRRSYAVYLVHVPIVQGLMVVSAEFLHLGYWPMVGLVALLTPILVFILSDLLHRFIEQPGIVLGKHLARWFQPSSVAPQMPAASRRRTVAAE
jgi:peptidoglycan/LPS O-acetylase OafA/YrhL